MNIFDRSYHLILGVTVGSVAEVFQGIHHYKFEIRINIQKTPIVEYCT